MAQGKLQDKLLDEIYDEQENVNAKMQKEQRLMVRHPTTHTHTHTRARARAHARTSPLPSQLIILSRYVATAQEKVYRNSGNGKGICLICLLVAAIVILLYVLFSEGHF